MSQIAEMGERVGTADGGSVDGFEGFLGRAKTEGEMVGGWCGVALVIGISVGRGAGGGTDFRETTI